MKLQKSKFLYNEYYLLTVSLDSLSLSPSLSLSLSLSLSRTHTLSAFHVLLGHTPISSTPHTALAPHLSSGQHAPLPLEPPPPPPPHCILAPPNSYSWWLSSLDAAEFIPTVFQPPFSVLHDVLYSILLCWFSLFTSTLSLLCVII